MWRECGTACPPTCDNYNTTVVCSQGCVSGCFCPEGKVELEGVCVDPFQCPGMFNTPTTFSILFS